MRRPEDLTELIQSMSKSEKRYFKLFAGRHVREKSSKYVELFDLLARGDAESNNGKSEAELKETAGIRNLPSAKHYLYGLIMSALRAYHAGKSVHKRLREGIEDAELLFARGLLDQAARLLKQLYTLAEQREDFHALLLIVRRQREMISSRADIVSDLDHLFKLERGITRRVVNLRHYQEISARVFRLIREFGHSSHARQPDPMQQLKQHLLLTDESYAHSLTAKLFYYSTRAGIAYYEDDRYQLYDFCRRHAEVCETFYDAGGMTAERLADSLHNYMHACLDLDMYDELAGGLKKLDALELKDEYARIRSRITHLSLRAVVVAERGGETDMRDFLREYAAEHPQVAPLLNLEQERLLAVRMALVNFRLRRHSDALDALAPILQAPRSAPRHDIAHSAETMSLMLHFFLGDWNYLENAIAALRRRGSLRDFRFMRMTVDVIEKVLRAAPAEQESLLRAAQRELRELFDSPENDEVTAMNRSILRLWMEQLPEAAGRRGK